MQKLFLVFITSLLLWGCSASVETVNMAPDKRLEYAMSLYNNEEYETAVNEFQNITLQFPGNTVVDDAQYYLGMTRFKREEYILAAYEFSRLIKSMPASEFVSNSQFMLAECYYLLSPDFSLDQSYTKNSIKEFQTFIDFFPADEKVTEAERKINELNDKLARKAYNTANIYETMEYNTAAIIYYTNVFETYHDTQYAPLALYRAIKIQAARNLNRDAMQNIELYLNRYPSGNRKSELETLKSTLENKLTVK